MTTLPIHSIAPLPRAAHVPTPSRRGVSDGMIGGLIVLAGLIVFGCAFAQKTTHVPVRELPPPTTLPTATIDGAGKTVTTAAKTYADTGAEIARQAEKIETVAPVAVPQTTVIRAQLDAQKSATENLVAVTYQLGDANRQVTRVGAERDWWMSYGKGADKQLAEQDKKLAEQDKKLTEQDKKLADATADAAKERHEQTNRLLLLGGILFGASIIAVVALNYFLPAKEWFALLLIGPAIGGYAVGIDLFATYAPILIVGVIVLVLIALAMVTYRFGRTILDKKCSIKTLATGFNKVVETVDGVREECFDAQFVQAHLALNGTETPAAIIQKVVDWQEAHVFSKNGVANTIQDDPHTWRLVGVARGGEDNNDTPGADAVRQAA